MAALIGKIIHLKIAPDEDNAGLKEADNKIGSKDSQLGSKWQKAQKETASPWRGQPRGCSLAGLEQAAGLGCKPPPAADTPELQSAAFCSRGRENSACLGDCFTAMVIRQFNF